MSAVSLFVGSALAASAQARRALAVLVVASILAPASARAGAWTQPSGTAYIKVAAAGLDTRSRFDRDGNRVGFDDGGGLTRSTEFRSRELRIYGEYGASDAVTIYGSLAYKDLATEQLASRFEARGGGDLYAGVRYRLRDGSVPVSLSIDGKIPTGYDITDQPSLGTGKADLGARLLAGTSFGRAYVTGDAGFLYRSGRYRNEMVFSGEAGTRLPGPIYTRALLRGIHALGRPATEDQGAIFDPGLSSPRELLLVGTVGLDVGDGVSLEAALAHVLNGREALAGNTVEISVVMLLGPN